MLAENLLHGILRGEVQDDDGLNTDNNANINDDGDDFTGENFNSSVKSSNDMKENGNDGFDGNFDEDEDDDDYDGEDSDNDDHSGNGDYGDKDDSDCGDDDSDDDWTPHLVSYYFILFTV